MTPRCALSSLRSHAAPAPPKRLRGFRQPKGAIRANWRCSAEACQTCVAGNPHGRPRTQAKGRTSANAWAENRRHTKAPRAGFGQLDSEIRGWMHKAMKPLEGVAKVASAGARFHFHAWCGGPKFWKDNARFPNAPAFFRAFAWAMRHYIRQTLMWFRSTSSKPWWGPVGNTVPDVVKREGIVPDVRSGTGTGSGKRMGRLGK